MNETRTPVAVLIGGGGRLPAIVEATQRAGSKAALRLVVSYKKLSPGLEWAGGQGLETRYWRWADWREQGYSRAEYDAALAALLLERRVELVVLAGWGLLLSPAFLDQFPGRVINVHPALLTETAEAQVRLKDGRRIPIFRGNDAIRLALEAGVDTTGCTVHYVTPEMDCGPVLLKQEVPVRPGDDLAALAERIHRAEDDLLPAAIELAIERLTNSR